MSRGMSPECCSRYYLRKVKIINKIILKLRITRVYLSEIEWYNVIHYFGCLLNLEEKLCTLRLLVI